MFKAGSALTDWFPSQRDASRMQDFSDQISYDDRFTEEEKLEVIARSFEW